MQFQIDSKKMGNSGYKKQNIFFYKLTLRGFANCCSFAGGKKLIVIKSEWKINYSFVLIRRLY